MELIEIIVKYAQKIILEVGGFDKQEQIEVQYPGVTNALFSAIQNVLQDF